MQDDDFEALHLHDELPASRSVPRYELVRTPAKVRATFLIISERACAKPTHWIRGRTMPCLENDACEGCLADIEQRWKVYLWILQPQFNSINPLELTDHGGEPVMAFQKANGSLRGRRITVWRSGKKDNSPVNAAVSPQMDMTIHIPPCPDMEHFLQRMWHMRKNRDSRPLFSVPTVEARVNEPIPSYVVPASSSNGHHKKPRSK